jgi:hypothetical protein
MASDRTRFAVNVAGVNAGWFACVLGAARGAPWLGIMVVAALLAVHLGFNRPARTEMRLALAGAVFGFFFDTALIAGGAYEARRWLMPAPLATLWLLALWVNFALVLNVALRCLHERHALAAFLGAVGGPAAYFAGERFGALTLCRPLPYSLVPLAATWAAAIPVLLWVAGRLRSSTQDNGTSS